MFFVSDFLFDDIQVKILVEVTNALNLAFGVLSTSKPAINQHLAILIYFVG